MKDQAFAETMMSLMFAVAMDAAAGVLQREVCTAGNELHHLEIREPVESMLDILFLERAHAGALGFDPVMVREWHGHVNAVRTS
jgi:hypothetical protein